MTEEIKKYNLEGFAFEISTLSEDETNRLGQVLGDFLIPGDIVCLDGDLGTGKTVFTKGLAKSLGIKETVTSPTFTILSEFEDGKTPLYHFDVYRIGCEDEFSDSGFEDYFYSRGVCVIEWAGKIIDIIPDNAIRIFFMGSKSFENEKRKVVFVFPKKDKRAKTIKERLEKS